MASRSSAVRFNSSEAPKPAPQQSKNLVPFGLALGAGIVGWYYYMYGGAVEKKGVDEFVKNQEKIVEREHQASKDQVTSME
ncbi:hypothetical protein CcaverHIS002_0609250 [Cutaneotrichosporon cavernicola]|nr:hypothetical protein CcaverHIS002_0609250 [Cutaneotrichosporon cavernicola]